MPALQQNIHPYSLKKFNKITPSKSNVFDNIWQFAETSFRPKLDVGILLKQVRGLFSNENQDHYLAHDISNLNAIILYPQQRGAHFS